MGPALARPTSVSSLVRTEKRYSVSILGSNGNGRPSRLRKLRPPRRRRAYQRKDDPVAGLYPEYRVHDLVHCDPSGDMNASNANGDATEEVRAGREDKDHRGQEPHWIPG